jgi:hypothetical protein
MTSEAGRRERKQGRIGLRQQVLRAALDCSGGDLQKAFTAEDLLLAAWKRDSMAWGLRGHETAHPDSERIYVEIDRASAQGSNVRGGLVGLGLFDKVRQRTYRLTAKGLAAASEVEGTDPSYAGKAERALADAIEGIVSHDVFREWIRNPGMPKHFRDAGHFWGIAPGTPASVIKIRVTEIDGTLRAARSLFTADASEVASRHGKILFDRTDIERAEAFQRALKKRFAKDLATLGFELPTEG